MLIKTNTFLDCMASGVIWSIPISRWANWHDMAHQPLEDAEMSVTCTRYLDGDPPPWDGANLRHGALVIDIIDKSGVYVGTSHGGTIFDGLARTAVQFGEDFIDSTQVVITDTSVPPEYYQGQTKLTMKQLPYVVFREGHTSPIQTSAWINSRPKASKSTAAATRCPASTKPSPPPSKPGSTCSAHCFSCPRWAPPSTPCSNLSTRTPSWPGGQSRTVHAQTIPAGNDSSNTTSRAPTRRTPSLH